MDLISLACEPEERLRVRIYYNIKTKDGDFNTKEILIDTNNYNIPENVWNVIIELSEE